MGKKFVFNPETLSFEKTQFTLKQFLKSVLPHIFSVLVLGSILGYALFTNVKTPEYKKLESENNVLVSDLQQLDQNTQNQITQIAKLENTDDNSYRSVLGLKPLPKSTRLLGYGGSERFRNYNFLKNGKLLKEVAMKSASTRNRIKLEAQSYDQILHLVKDRDKMINSIPSVMPISNKDLIRIGSGFGYRMHPILHVLKMHTGVDLCANRGTPIYATGDGIVVQASATSGGYGNCIRINHGYTYLTLYAHLSKILVAEGQKVKRGQLIGLVGSTGRSTGPHLHYEVRINGTPVNPVNFFYNDMTEKQYEMMISQAMSGQSDEPM